MEEAQDLIKSWKNPELRADGAAHPVGDIDLGITGGEGETTSLPCVGLATALASCWPSCSNTVWAGSCQIMSVGCCKPHLEPTG
ncbi:hypothetical protein Pth03_37800 [Planotetraspora thailandica]|uniref:Mersacidin/lichenicidin family type 2 lantibiotic n=2 Tax=Planotetraspora thailandica TaxID=487172 RepID=A0A8J3V286_9ACTN|nr:hypothetical protein Pth03_37800 [Planotetraspora thailandica]